MRAIFHRHFLVASLRAVRPRVRARIRSVRAPSRRPPRSCPEAQHPASTSSMRPSLSHHSAPSVTTAASPGWSPGRTASACGSVRTGVPGGHRTTPGVTPIFGRSATGRRKGGRAGVGSALQGSGRDGVAASGPASLRSVPRRPCLFRVSKWSKAPENFLGCGTWSRLRAAMQWGRNAQPDIENACRGGERIRPSGAHLLQSGSGNSDRPIRRELPSASGVFVEQAGNDPRRSPVTQTRLSVNALSRACSR